MHILQTHPCGQFGTDQLDLMPRRVIPHDQDLLPLIQPHQRLHRFQDGGTVLPIQPQGSACPGVLVQEPDKRLGRVLPVHLQHGLRVLLILGPAHDLFLVDAHLIGREHHGVLIGQRSGELFSDFLDPHVNRLFIGPPAVEALELMEGQPGHAQQEIIGGSGGVVDVERG